MEVSRLRKEDCMNRKRIVSLTAAAVALTAVICCGCASNDSKEEEEKKEITINGVQYVETFCDDFDGDTLDETKWETCPEWDRQGGCSHWNPANVSLDGQGNLLLKADYTEGSDLLQCGAIRTYGKFEQTYGYFEIRCKFQTKDGFWSAFWMMPRENSDAVIGGGDGTEIDIFEQVNINKAPTTGKAREFDHVVHWDGYEASHRSIARRNQSGVDIYDGNFHTFAVDWSKDAYVFYIDGVLSATINASDIPGGTSAVDQYMKITLESGSWSGAASAEDMPDYFTVDYVKAYQRAEYLEEAAGK